MVPGNAMKNILGAVVTAQTVDFTSICISDTYKKINRGRIHKKI